MANGPLLHVATIQQPFHAYVGVCATHGPLGIYWTQPWMAAMDLWGHAAHFHSRPLPANPRNDVPCT